MGYPPRIIKHCIICGKEISIIPSTANYRPHKYCSPQCYGKGKTMGLSNAPKTILHFVCQYCGNKFDIERSKCNPKRKYCDRTCASKARSAGIKHRSTDHRALADRMRVIARKTPCQICGYKRVVHVAHIIPHILGGKLELDNVLFLCPNHHYLFDNHKLNKTELSKLSDHALLVYNAGLNKPYF